MPVVGYEDDTDLDLFLRFGVYGDSVETVRSRDADDPGGRVRSESVVEFEGRDFAGRAMLRACQEGQVCSSHDQWRY